MASQVFLWHRKIFLKVINWTLATPLRATIEKIGTRGQGDSLVGKGACSQVVPCAHLHREIKVIKIRVG